MPHLTLGQVIEELFFFQKPVEDKYPVGPWLLALFIFVVCGSGKKTSGKLHLWYVPSVPVLSRAVPWVLSFHLVPGLGEGAIAEIAALSNSAPGRCR